MKFSRRCLHSHRFPYHCRSFIQFFGISSSLYQSPIWIKVAMVKCISSVTLSPRSGDQKIFGSLPCPKRVSQIMWLSASPKVAHGTGSKDVDNSIVLGGADYQSSLVVLPHPKQVHRSSHPVIEAFLMKIFSLAQRSPRLASRNTPLSPACAQGRCAQP